MKTFFSRRPAKASMHNNGIRQNKTYILSPALRQCQYANLHNSRAVAILSFISMQNRMFTARLRAETMFSIGLTKENNNVCIECAKP